jgi:protein-L-isoaspartate(D-aspartate) O-methyltransferase
MSTDPDRDPYSSERLKMVAGQLQARGIADERVLNAMAKVPRHEFVSAKYWDPKTKPFRNPISLP